MTDPIQDPDVSEDDVGEFETEVEDEIEERGGKCTSERGNVPVKRSKSESSSQKSTGSDQKASKRASEIVADSGEDENYYCDEYVDFDEEDVAPGDHIWDEDAEDLETQRRSIQRLSKLKSEEFEIYRSLERHLSSTISQRQLRSKSPGHSITRRPSSQDCKIDTCCVYVETTPATCECKVPVTNKSSIGTNTSGVSIGTNTPRLLLSKSPKSPNSFRERSVKSTIRLCVANARTALPPRVRIMERLAGDGGGKTSSARIQDDGQWAGYPLRQLFPILSQGVQWLRQTLNAFRVFIPTP